MNANDHPVTATLARAEEVYVEVHRRSRRLIRHQAGFGAASLVAVLMVGMFDHPVVMVVSTGAWVAALTVLSACVLRQPVERRATSVTHSVMIAVWGLLFPGVLVVGLEMFPGQLAWWVLGAVVVALPGFVSAYLTARRLVRVFR